LSPTRRSSSICRCWRAVSPIAATNQRFPPGRVGLSCSWRSLQTPGLSQLAEETKLPQWQQWVGYHDASATILGLCRNRMNPEQLRRACRFINRKLKRGKAIGSQQDARVAGGQFGCETNQFCSDHRCCADCLTRESPAKMPRARVQEDPVLPQTGVCAVERAALECDFGRGAMRPGDGGMRAALRLLRRMRQTYGPRFLIWPWWDSWYTNGPFLKRWPRNWVAVVAVLKQNGIYLSGGAGPHPGKRRRSWNGARSPTNARWKIWMWRRCASAIPIPTRFGWSACGRVGRSERNRAGVEDREKRKTWIWVVAGDLDTYDGAAIRDFGHLPGRSRIRLRRGLTQHWHLTHVAHHKPVAVLALLWIKIHRLHALSRLCIVHGKLFRLWQGGLQELRKRHLPLVALWLAHRCFSG